MAEEGRGTGRFRRWGLRVLAVIGLLSVLGVLVVLLLAVALLATRERVPGRTIVELDLEEELVEYLPEEPLAQALQGRRTTVRDVVEGLQRAAEDERVLALVARVGGGGLGFGQVEEVRDAVAAFRASGKPAILYSETFGEVTPGHGGYYLATAFEQIVMQPSGDVNLTGLIAVTPFLRGALDALGIKPRFDHRHEYKDAKYLLTEREYTEPHREARKALLESEYGQLVGAIASARGLSEEQVRQTLARGPLYGQEAVEARLVDRLAYRDEVYDALKARVGGNAEFLFLSHYLRRAGRPHTQGETIALIYGVGAVQRGESQFNPVFGGMVMGSETVTRAFHKAIEDRSVRAIIFRIDSPGGSYVASDAIWRAVVRARAAGKPVIATMGNTAASGGYYVAMAANHIVAQPSTLTGSIGVVGGKPVTEELWKRLGIHFDDVRVGDNTTMYSFVKDYSPEEWSRVQAWLDRVYADFTGKVAEGRGMTPEQVHQVARGRVWTGADARGNGLVDELGGFPTALRLARQEAGIAPEARVRLKVFPEERTLLEALLETGPKSSRPEASHLLLARTLEALQPLFLEARQAGLLPQAGALTLPPVERR